jgi:AraC family L-rhamnose operon transcriptional activator RhaR
MLKENLHEPFEIVIKELNECPKKEHEHTFFELVYILSGTGQQCINKNTFAYHAGNLFLITPDDSHSFTIETTTQFFFLRFSDIYIKNSTLQSDSVQRLEFILQNANHEATCILKNQTDKALVKPIVEAIIREYVNRSLYNKELIHQLVNTLIVVVARNLAMYLPDQINEQSEEKALAILQYIQHHIYTPEKISAENLGRHFGISESYLGRYFKKHTNETMQEYITHYRLKLIENRLMHSDMRIIEIANELGFTDESHLNRTFKKYKGVSPTAYRKTLRHNPA